MLAAFSAFSSSSPPGVILFGTPLQTSLAYCRPTSGSPTEISNLNSSNSMVSAVWKKLPWQYGKLYVYRWQSPQVYNGSSRSCHIGVASRSCLTCKLLRVWTNCMLLLDLDFRINKYYIQNSLYVWLGSSGCAALMKPTSFSQNEHLRIFDQKYADVMNWYIWKRG